MTIRMLVIDDELGRLEYKRQEFLARWNLFPDEAFGRTVEVAFTTSQREENGRIVNDESVALETVAYDPESLSLILLDMQFDHGLLVEGEPVEADPLFGLRIQAALEREYPEVPVVQFTAQAQKDLTRHDGTYLSKIDGTLDDLRLLLVELGRVSLRDKARLLRIPSDTIVASDATIAVYAAAYRRASMNAAPLLIRGETGTGKEHLARYFHAMTRPEGSAWVALQVSAIPSTLYESTLFGHEKGSFTGADTQRKGAFAEAEGGTLFLDEIGALPSDLQAKLLRVLGERRYQRLGSATDITVDCTIVAATQDDLETLGFRPDLLARFRQVTLPALRERPRELLAMAEHFLARLQRENGRRGLVLSVEAREALLAAPFADNARGLNAAIEHAVISLSSNSVIRAAHLGLMSQPRVSLQAQTGHPAQETTGSASSPSSPAGTGSSWWPASEALAAAAIPETPAELKGALARLDAVSLQQRHGLAIAALKACRHPVSQKPFVLPAMQLLLSNEALTPMQARRKLNELLGRPQTAPQGEDWLRAVCAGAAPSAPAPSTPSEDTDAE